MKPKLLLLSLLFTLVSYSQSQATTTFINGQIDYANAFRSGAGLNSDVTLYDRSNDHFVLLTKPSSAKEFRIFVTDSDFNTLKIFRIDPFYLNSSFAINNFYLYPVNAPDNTHNLLVLETNLGFIKIDLDALKAKQYILQPGFFDPNFSNIEAFPRVELNKASSIKLPN